MTSSADNPSKPPHHEVKDTPARSGLAAAVLRGGEEPDPRFTLANERTFLAWIRTALALLAGGIAVEAFTSDLFLRQTRMVLAVLLLVLAMTVALGAAVRWLRVEQAMRQKKPLPLPALVPVLALGGVLVAGIILVSFITRIP